MYFRVLDSAKRPMQRLGYLKYVLSRCVALETSNAETLGRDLVDAVARNVRVPLTEERADYIRRRLTDRIYKPLRAQVDRWQGDGSGEAIISMELQDLYLADWRVPSRTGKLVSEDWRKYPVFGVHLGLIRPGTWSPLDRGVALLRLTSKAELESFHEYRSETNPLLISEPQGILLLYCLLENDGDVLKRLFVELSSSEDHTFTDRDAGDLLPQILRDIALPLRNRSMPVEERDRLEQLLKIADSIERWRDRPYSGGSAREEAIRPRLEPLCDIGFLAKDDAYRYEYRLTSAASAFFETLADVGDVDRFLESHFFEAWVAACGPAGTCPATLEETRVALFQAWADLKSPIGYAPITDVALLGGIYALTETGVWFEVGPSADLLRDWQKEHPRLIRFGVDRQGNMAHVRFLGEPAYVPLQIASS